MTIPYIIQGASSGMFLPLRTKWPKACSLFFFSAPSPAGPLDPTCANGLEGFDGVSNGGVEVCCSATCGECTQNRCKRRGPKSECCPNIIGRDDREQEFCDDTGSAPCILGGEGCF